MLFPTLDFGIFFLVIFILAWSFKDYQTTRKVILICASYFFYGYWDWRFCFLLAASSIGNYFAGILIEHYRANKNCKWFLGIAITFNLTILCFFKYYGFFIESLNDLIFNIGLHHELPFLEIILPVGISFFTFQGISYVIDVYRGSIRASRSLLSVILYISFFAQLVAGPIVRAASFLPQIEAKATIDAKLASAGMLMILLGLVKKVIIANYLATEIVDRVFMEPDLFGPVDLLLAAYGYAIQIYCDFSAYSDIAIGVAALFGYRFHENFNQPYRSWSLREFWQRWHISLSSWLRDYLYIPLGGSHKGLLRTQRNLFITMLLGGIWHGAGWNFILWGGLHGAGLAFERMVGWGHKLKSPSVIQRVLGTLLVFHFVCLGWIFFRTESLELALAYLTSFTNIDAQIQYTKPFIISLLAIGMASQFIPVLLQTRIYSSFYKLPVIIQGSIVGFTIIAIDAFGATGVAPFIYFRF